MGLIMLILVGTVPLTYALNHAMPASHTAQFVAIAEATQLQLRQSQPQAPTVAPQQSRQVITTYLRTKEATTEVVPALANLAQSIGEQVSEHGSLNKMPADSIANVRNDMYLASEAIRLMESSGTPALSEEVQQRLHMFKGELDQATKFLPLWVKVAVAIALGLGTMVGWKRIVVTVGEKIGKTHLTYAQGASAELIAMATIGAADMYGMPVSTTHVLSSGVAGTMAANKSGLQMSTLRNLLMAWVLTLPAAMLLSGCLYWILYQLF